MESEMDVRTNTTAGARSAWLVDGEVLVGKVLRSFTQGGKILGVILTFAGKAETALLNHKQMVGKDPKSRLANLAQGDELTVKIQVTPEHKIWASETDVEVEYLAEILRAQKGTRILGKIVNQSKFGLFVELQTGLGAGRKALVHWKNMTTIHASPFSPGANVWVDVLSAHVDAKGTLRIDLRISGTD